MFKNVCPGKGTEFITGKLLCQLNGYGLAVGDIARMVGLGENTYSGVH